MDDDFTLADEFVLNDMVKHADLNNNEQQILGFTGTIFHPNIDETYEHGFHVNANKFSWSDATALPWQQGIVYAEESCLESNGLRSSGQQIFNATSTLNSRPWHSTPKWVWEQIQIRKKRKLSSMSSSSSSSSSSASSSSSFSSSLSSFSSTTELSSSCSQQDIQNRDLKRGKSSKVVQHDIKSGGRLAVAVAVAVAVDIIKGRMMFLHTNALRKVPFTFTVNDIRGDDIAISGIVSGGTLGQHHVIRTLAHRILELPAPHALCATKGVNHYERREAVRRRYFSASSLSGRVIVEGAKETTSVSPHGKKFKS